jgi:tungstate transport system permease protein
VEGLPDGLLVQAQALGASRLEMAMLALREARVGIVAAILAALGTSLSEVAAIVLVGGNIYGYNQTLASATLYEVNAADYSMALAIAIVLLGMILILMGSFALLQHQSGGLRLRFRTAT